jgi:Tartrate dehydratase beta subunit/Fumarate hydratase class I, C-terminal domain
MATPAARSSKPPTTIQTDIYGAEAIRRLEIENFPVIVVIDKDGNNLYETAIEKYRKRIEEN